jgi:hypothetical protein
MTEVRNTYKMEILCGKENLAEHATCRKISLKWTSKK